MIKKSEISSLNFEAREKVSQEKTIPELKKYEKNKNFNIPRLKKEIKASNSIVDFKNVGENQTHIYIYGDSISNETDLDNVIQNHESIIVEDLIKEEAYRYTEQRQKDAVIEVNTLMAELRIQAQQNNHPREVLRSIEDTFKPVTDALLWGWWVTALEEVNEIEVGGFVTQELYDRIKNRIEEYIQENY